jgi:hypothetical protein
MKRLSIAICVAFSISLGASSLAEDVTITTFYPSPFGDYDELTTKGKTTLATDSTANVGIGTTAPGAKLDIEVPNTGVQSLIFLSTAGERGGIAKLSYDATLSGFFPLTLDLDDNSLSFKRPLGIIGGNVGIGTTTPDTSLDVAGTISITADQGFNRSQSIRANQNIFVINAGSEGFYINSDDNATTDFSVKGDGKVGIGTGAPGAKLDIEVPNTGTQSLIFLSTPGERGGIAKLTYSTVSPFPLILDLDTNSFNIPRPIGIVGGNVGIGTTDPQDALHVLRDDAGIRSYVLVESANPTDFGEAAISLKTPQNRWDIYMDDDSNNEVPDGGLGFFSGDAAAVTTVFTNLGDVGIGITTPTNPLHVSKALGTGSAVDDLQIVAENSSTASVDRLAGIGFINRKPAGTPIYRGIFARKVADSIVRMDFEVDGDPSLTGGNVDPEMVIRDNGNVGIGTTFPKSTLQIDGSLGLNAADIITANLTLDDTHNIILCNNSADITVTLPEDGSALFRTYYVKKIGDNSSVITIAPQSGEKLESVTNGTKKLFIKGDTVRLVSRGGGFGWFIIDEMKSAHVAKMRATTVQTVTSNTCNVVNFDEILIEQGIEASTTTERFTIKESGIYLIRSNYTNFPTGTAWIVYSVNVPAVTSNCPVADFDYSTWMTSYGGTHVTHHSNQSHSDHVGGTVHSTIVRHFDEGDTIAMVAYTNQTTLSAGAGAATLEYSAPRMSIYQIDAD